MWLVGVLTAQGLEHMADKKEAEHLWWQLMAEGVVEEGEDMLLPPKLDLFEKVKKKVKKPNVWDQEKMGDLPAPNLKQEPEVNQDKSEFKFNPVPPSTGVLAPGVVRLKWISIEKPNPNPNPNPDWRYY